MVRSFVRGLVGSAILIACPGYALAGPLQESNRQIVVDFYDTAFVRHQPTAAAKKHMGEVYIQHNPRVPNGPVPFYSFFEKLFQQNPGASSEIKRVLADDDLVAIHSHSRANPQDRGRAIVDIFRVADGKIVEHWDVIQDVPEGSANGNTMFDGGSK